MEGRGTQKQIKRRGDELLWVLADSTCGEGRDYLVQGSPCTWEPESLSTAEVGSTAQCRGLHFLVSILQLSVIYRGSDLDPACPEVSGYLKPITILHSCYRFKNVSGIMSNSIEKRLWASNKAAVTFLPSIFPGCRDTPPQGEGVYKFNLVVHTRVDGGTNQLSLWAVTSSQPVSNGQ